MSVNNILVIVIDFYIELFLLFNNWNGKKYNKWYNFLFMRLLRDYHKIPYFFLELEKDLKEIWRQNNDIGIQKKDFKIEKRFTNKAKNKDRYFITLFAYALDRYSFFSNGLDFKDFISFIICLKYTPFLYVGNTVIC